MQLPQPTYFKDYTPSDYTIPTCSLEFIIDSGSTRVDNVMEVVRTNPNAKELRLNGEMMELELLWVDDVLMEEGRYARYDDAIVIPLDTDSARIRAITRLYPDENTALEGLYRSGGIWCTQNEPEGFRRITYFIDRPDVMTRFTTKIIANQERCPILLSNGNLRGTATLENGKHMALWEDPIPKPCYLFALVAGDLGSIHDTFITMSGKKVDLAIYCDRGNEEKCHHAMRSLKKSMEWDEVTYGREYDLEVYNIVAVDSFNMGAMENKGLNVFNSHYVLADEKSATDGDFMGIESVIAHEYFHNWTGNRITCRNWFELTLKEGLTVFRDQCFSADMNSPLIQRIDDVKSLRERQFLEDAGPTAHPIKPDHFIEINNFYTATVYEKGAEVIRMLHTLLGEEKFRLATDYYFEKFDGQAVGTEEFLESMQSQSPIDLSQFKRWYSQERTPILTISSEYEENNQRLKLKIIQTIPKDTHGREQLPYAFPFALGLLECEGKEFILKSSNAKMVRDGIVWIDEAISELVFEDIASQPKLSLNRNFSTPVKIVCDEIDYPFLMAHDSDGFVRYEASQVFAMETLEDMMRGEEINPQFIKAYGMILEDTSLEAMFKAELLALPSINTMMQRQEILDVPAIHRAIETVKKELAHTYKELLIRDISALYTPQNSSIDAVSMANRALLNRCLGVLMSLENEAVSAMCLNHYRESLSMSSRLVALDLLENYAPELAGEALNNFYQQHSHETLIMNKYFALLASSQREGTLERVIALQEDSAFDIKVPNLVRALYGAFSRNAVAFHTSEGYAFIADKVIEMDALNPQIASGLAGAFKSYSKLSPLLKEDMGTQLERIKNHEGLSNNVYEIITKILEVE
ncbi:MAG: aminopeptidase N [Sulfuricurvum sp.]|uniref:aminopeptidase N n=1 Tax=Sulfuricurvum sp. TaxID=2025608 RepID=UPI002606BBC1|nr:aminopeptidase N [Sulfuricurvum sp.]MDD2829785.1 aminopeptidase N [Sulfuricurvum sp.]MDD4948421.1 aminopeptidase N [Sulfuricurvum sp.]